MWGQTFGCVARRVGVHLLPWMAVVLASWTPRAVAGEYFLEAESFTTSGGWSVIGGPAAKAASGLKMLGGASGAKDGVATATVAVKDAGHYRVWVRFSSHPKWRGPFHVTILAENRVLADGLFDTEFDGRSNRDRMAWGSFEADLPEGQVTLRLSKHQNQNAVGLAREVDCLLLTMNDKLVPNHLNYGAQTFLRVTLGEGYDRPAYIHIFADHFHAPWYQHYALGRAGAVQGIAPKKGDFLKSVQSTAWCNITPMIYQDSGAMLHITARYAYTDIADHLQATFAVSTAPDEASIVRTLKIDYRPGKLALFIPPNLLTPENRELLKTDGEIAEATGRLADAHPWPTHGKRPTAFPFFVTQAIDSGLYPSDAKVAAREHKTLDYFGFMSEHLRHLGGAWFMKDESYCNPDVEKMEARLREAAAKFKQRGGRVQDVAYCELTDEPGGQSLEFAASDPSYAKAFRAWLKAKGLTPADLLVPDWDAVRIVTSDGREAFPALYYFSQQFRTRALGDFMATQRRIAEKAYGGTFPVLANFSDGAVYCANFYAQGVDYFELLDAPDQNAIWGEDWANGSSTYQCATYNVDLMRAAARERGQLIAHFLVAHAGRKPWDVKLKATSEVARGVKILKNFCYGPVWATHEGGPYWRSHVWQGKPETWTANASITREIGAVEDLLVPAMPAPAKVALLYSSSSDVWTVGKSFCTGFDRMHTWLALSHAQMPVDIVAERQVERGMLDGYRACYLSGPNLTRAAAAKLKQWVQQGGTLWLTAGAAQRDQYDRPLQLLDDLLPAVRGETVELQKFQGSGRYLSSLQAKDEVRWEGGTASVLGVKQPLTARPEAATLATFKEGGAAIVRGVAGKGTVYCCGFLPALAYIKPALDHRVALQKKVDEDATLDASERAEAELLKRSQNPWKFPGEVRDVILRPAREAKIAPPLRCDQALVDAVYMPHDKGILVPLANYTLRPIDKLTLSIDVPRPVAKVESAVRGAIGVRQSGAGSVEVSLPLENNDFLVLRY